MSISKVQGSEPDRRIDILLINPNSTYTMTKACLESVQRSIPSHVVVYGYTAESPSPSAIESQSDAASSTTDFASGLGRYDAFLVACFSAHPLIAVLREQTSKPVIGIMEAALYSARMLGGRFGIVNTGPRSKIMSEDAVRNYGLQDFSVGNESSGLGVLELASKPREEVLDKIGEAALRLKQRGADCILLGCAGMTDMKEACQEAVGPETRVLDGIGIGIQMLVGLVREDLSTAKTGLYRSAEETRSAREQLWREAQS